MLALSQLQNAIDEAIDGFADRVVDIVSEAPASARPRTAAPQRPKATVASTPKSIPKKGKQPLPKPGKVASRKKPEPKPAKVASAPKPLSPATPTTSLGRKVLRVVSENRQGVTANDIADELHVGFAPIFDELRSLMASGALLRIVRGDDQLPVYVQPDR